MEFVSEKEIEKVALLLDANPSDYPEEIEAFGRKQPALLAYLFSEHFDLLTQDEREYLLYLTLVIWKTVESLREGKVISEKEVEIAEEKNWDLLSHVVARRFRERVDVLFQDYAQEDLLAFVEDALMDDEDTLVSKEGREPMFVSLKTIIDVLSQ